MSGVDSDESSTSELRQAFGLYRATGYDLRRWASGDETAHDDDFVPLRLVFVQALALMAFLAFAGLALAASPAERMQSFAGWLMLLAPIAGIWLLIRNFASRQ